MPRYDYYCPNCGGQFEAWRGVEDNSTPCPTCGTDAERAFCSGLPAIRGETVGKGYTTSGPIDSGVISKHGYMNLDLFQEAHAAVLDDCSKAHAEPPDFWEIAKERVATGKAGPSRITK